jgi:hypothetical protein
MTSVNVLLNILMCCFMFIRCRGARTTWRRPAPGSAVGASAAAGHHQTTMVSFKGGGGGSSTIGQVTPLSVFNAPLVGTSATATSAGAAATAATAATTKVRFTGGGSWPIDVLASHTAALTVSACSDTALESATSIIPLGAESSPRSLVSDSQQAGSITAADESSADVAEESKASHSISDDGALLFSTD